MKLCYENFWGGFNPNEFYFTSILKTITNVEIVKDNPDLVIHTVFGHPNNLLKYKCKKVFWTGENILVGTNPIIKVLAKNYPHDFSLTFEEDDDLNIQCPLWVLYLDYVNVNSNNYYLKTVEKRKPLVKEHYCNFIYSNPAYNTSPRYEFFKKLSSLKEVHSLGKFSRNIEIGDFNKQEHIKKYTFTFGFENSYDYYYNTEKLLEPLLSSSVPLYWGGDNCFNFFKKEQIIFCNNKTFDKIFEEMESIYNDEKKLYRITSEPIFNKFPEKFKPKTIATKIMDML